MLVHVEKVPHLEMIKHPSRKDGFEGTQKWASIGSRVMVTNFLERHGFEIKIDSMQNDGSCVTELLEENEKLIQYEEAASRMGKPVAKTIVQTGTLHTSFFSCSLHNSFHAYHFAWLKCLYASFHLHVIHDERLIVRSLSVSMCFSFSCFSPLFTSSLPLSTCTPTCTPSSMSTATRETTAALSPNEEYYSLATYHPPTGYEPNVLDDFHYSETSEVIFQEESGDIDTDPSNLCDAELDDEHRKSAIFTTVHSGARRTSEPETSL